MARKISAATKREAVLHSHNGTPFRMTARHLGVSETSVRRWWEHWDSKRFVIMPRHDREDHDVVHDWYIKDRQQGKTVGEGYETPSDAQDAIFEFL